MMSPLLLLLLCFVFALCQSSLQAVHLPTTSLSTPQLLRSLISESIPFSPPPRLTSNQPPATQSSRANYVQRNTPKPEEKPFVDLSFYADYPTIADYYKKWRKLADDYPDIIRYRVLGKSSKGRDIVLLEIGRTSTSSPQRVFVNALQHAREWISAIALTFVAEALAVDWHHREETFKLLSKVQVFVVPLVNPDGYWKSFKPGNRLWRKNLRDPPADVPPECSTGIEDENVGVDLNRNWDVDFAGPFSSSHVPCEESYHGPYAFSENETKTLKQFIEDTEGIMAHLDFHSYGQFVLGPWAYTKEEPKRADRLDIVGRALSNSMKKSGQAYEYGRGSNFKREYAASGIMSDWVFSQGILSYTIELRPEFDESYTSNGFLLNATEIVPTGEEALDAVLTIMAYASDTEKFLKDNALPDGAPSKTNNTETPKDGSESSVPVGFIVGLSTGVASVVLVLIVLFLMVVRNRRKKLRMQHFEIEGVPMGQALMDPERDARFTSDSFSLEPDGFEDFEQAGGQITNGYSDQTASQGRIPLTEDGRVMAEG